MQNWKLFKLAPSGKFVEVTYVHRVDYSVNSVSLKMNEMEKKFIKFYCEQIRTMKS